MNAITSNDHAILKFQASNPGGWRIPTAGLAFDAEGNVDGTTMGGGANGSGVLFEVGPRAAKTILHNFGSGGERRRRAKRRTG